MWYLSDGEIKILSSQCTDRPVIVAFLRGKEWTEEAMPGSLAGPQVGPHLSDTKIHGRI